MPGMNSGVNVNDPTVIAAFTSALLHQGLIALLIFALLGLAWIAVRAWWPAVPGPGSQPAPDGGEIPDGGQAPASLPAVPLPVPEPSWRRLLRIGFGALWVFDGILQAQPKMAIGLPSQVIQPIAASSPAWVQHVVNWAGTTWSYHPLQAGASAVWIQIGIGVWLLAAPHGPLSRLAGLASVGWGLVVWAFGESFGGIFAPGLTWLFGAPGAAAVYCVAGALIALPERLWHSPRVGRAVLAGTGLFLVGMAVLQAWPGRGFWQGMSHHRPGTLAGMTASMARTPQPAALAGLIRAFTSFEVAHGFAVNLFAVTALAVIGVIFLTGQPRLVRPALIAFTVLCVADWVLIEDLGFLGGLGTDPNSMLPFILLATGGYLALSPGPATAPAPAAAAGWRERVRPASLRRGVATASFRSVAAAGAVGLIILGAAPMAAAQASPNADPILAEAIAGSTASLNFPAKPFVLTGQRGQAVSLASLRGKVVLLTFLDPVCTSDCPLIAQEFRAAGQLLGPDTRKVELVAIVANPVYHQLAYTQAFDRQENLASVPNWLFLTGSVPQLRQVWADYGVAAQVVPAGSMIAHNDVAYVIDRSGHVREELSTDPGPGTTATRSSFAVLLAGAAREALAAP
jgi:cytochrome oxidase Cu insertion factor (SCO1/SenC/PrrC family)